MESSIGRHGQGRSRKISITNSRIFREVIVLRYSIRGHTLAAVRIFGIAPSLHHVEPVACLFGTRTAGRSGP